MIVFENPENSPYSRALCQKCGTRITLSVMTDNICENCNTVLFTEASWMAHRIFFRQQYHDFTEIKEN